MADSFALRVLCIGSIYGNEAGFNSLVPRDCHESSDSTEVWLIRQGPNPAGYFVRRLPDTVTTRLNVQIGSPADRLGDYISENNVDLVIMTGHGRGGLTRIALGSVTDRLIGGEAPVLVV